MFLPPQPAVINRQQDCIRNEQIVDESNKYDLRFLVKTLLLITSRNQRIEKRKDRQIMKLNNSMTGLICSNVITITIQTHESNNYKHSLVQ